MNNTNALLEMEQAAKNPLGPPSHNGEPQSETTRLADLLDQVAHLIETYTKLPSKTLSLLIACWIALTYTYEHVQYCGYLALRSATPRCGKTRLLRLVAFLALDAPSITTNPTAPVLFRSQRKVLLLDEVDRLRNADKENFGAVLSVLNVGFEKGAVVERMEKTKGGNFEVKAFPTYRPVALAGIESLADTLSDRTFAIQMERTAERMPRFSARILDDLAGQLRAGFQAWADRYGDDVEAAYDSLPDEIDTLRGLDDRFQDIAEPLIVLASLADAERPEGPAILPRLLSGLHAAAGRREPSGREKQLMAFLEIAATKLGIAEKMFVRSADLLADCAAIEDLAFIETGRKLAGLLKHFDLYPTFNHAKTERGYWITRSWIETWRGRYAIAGQV